MGRYDKYFNITVKREIYVELKKLAETHGLSVPDFLALIVKTYNLVETTTIKQSTYWEVPSILLGKSQ